MINTIVKLVFPFLTLLLIVVFGSAEASPVASVPDIKQIEVTPDSVYLVKQGDTYYSLSRKFNISIETLKAWNGDKLQAGQKLYLTEPGTNRVPGSAVIQNKPEPDAPKVLSSPTSRHATPSSVGSTSAAASPVPKKIEHKTNQRILVVPFDPYLYFSDADYEIARQSKIPRQNVRQVFRGRLDALMYPKGYEAIHLLGGVYRDSVSELQTLYKSLHYSYQDNKVSKYNQQPPAVTKGESKGVMEWAKLQKEKIGSIAGKGPVPVAQDNNKHFGVQVKDSSFFSHFNQQYGIDYYVFINQFEVVTNYEHCLDRAAMNYARDFLVHYSIYDKEGKLVSGNKVKVPYQSNMNDIHRIASDNLPDMARRVLSDLPPAD